MGDKILILGNPLLREISSPVYDFKSSETKTDIESLKKELENFRRKSGFGRGISAVQTGIKKRIIALNLGKETFCIINPEITSRSAETFLMWDDCMSFPDLVVKVERNSFISISYYDETGKSMEWNNLSKDISELLQHEIDHLDGVLAVDRAVEKTDIIYKKEYLKNRGKYDTGIEYSINPEI
jgi:peptide deformylase